MTKIKDSRNTLPVLAVAVVLLILVLVFVFRIRHDMEDFSVNFEAGKRLRVAETLYRVEDEHYQFKYLPASAILYAPLTLFSFPVAKTIWYVLILACSGLMIFLSFRHLPQTKHRTFYVWLIPFLVLLKYFFREWDLGQINTVVSVVLLLMILSLIKGANTSRSEYWAGILWGIAVALKPYAAIFLLYLILKQKWKALFSGLVTLGIALLLPTFYYGFRGNWEVHKEWIATLSKSTPTLLTTQDNISLIALFQKWMGDQSSAFWLAGIAIAGLALLIFGMILLGWKRDHATFLEGAALLLCIPLVSPLGWDYTLIMSLPLLMLVIDNFARYSRFWQIILVFNLLITAITFYDLVGAQAYKLFMSWSVTTLSFLLILGYGAYLRVHKVC